MLRPRGVGGEAAVIGSLVHWFIGSLVHWFIGSSVHRFIGSSVHRFIGSSVHRFIGSLAACYHAADCADPSPGGAAASSAGCQPRDTRFRYIEPRRGGSSVIRMIGQMPIQPQPCLTPGVCGFPQCFEWPIHKDSLQNCPTFSTSFSCLTTASLS